MKKTYSIAEAKDGFTRLIRIVEAGDHVHITRRGRPVAVLLSREVFETLEPKRPGFAEALARFRELVGPEDLLDDEDLAGLRDQSSGREVEPWT